ncbi:MAG: Gfo/Idh/MocA family oxidoreductase, partial [Athalassotoga sp.]
MNPSQTGGDKMRVGIIGAGGIGTVHANCYKNIPDAKVVAVADIVPER